MENTQKINTNTTTEIYIPFTKRYILHKIINYGKPYSDYTTYRPIENSDNIETIYVDNQSCCKNTSPNIKPILHQPSMQNNVQNNVQNNIQNNIYYVEIHYTKESKKKKFETIMKNYEIDTLVEKYGNKV